LQAAGSTHGGAKRRLIEQHAASGMQSDMEGLSIGSNPPGSEDLAGNELSREKTN